MISPLIAPSLLSADFGRLAEEIKALEAAGADWLHVDVMDGRFVPNITLGPIIVEAIRKVTSLPLDVHLMIVEPEKHIDAFAKAGADHILIHAEATPHMQRTLAQIRHLGKKAGVALNPSTSEEAVRYVLNSVDQLLVMSVNPGFGGQAFLPSILPKINQLAQMIRGQKHPIWIGVDGGIDTTTVVQAARAGARVIVAGSSIFSQPAYQDAIHHLRSRAREGF
ncbi:ribulose-phosphate 3-epimerase [Pajaroellobacter abortibovis]|uniref:Ribulose-phosphate 3-epimerase n=1 Tax=Pajaroellobacter abortibovis TaxID=1882918 RepID=A0A1L6MUW4_9BACT|nr:ribulose-phosphate 3-epimerase [Pajaroellobacter abortibovis]APR99257.1 ribulose-phosphate 3-epimerase [Pajaroellobacter abortibovis]